MAIGDFTIRKIDKHNTEAGWAENASFIPEQGEFVVYDVDENYYYERFKIGDGVTQIDALPFALDEIKGPEQLSGKNGELSMVNYQTQFGLDHAYYAQNQDQMPAIQYQYSPRVDKSTGNIVVKTVSDNGTKFHHIYSDANKPTPAAIGAIPNSIGSITKSHLSDLIINNAKLDYDSVSNAKIIQGTIQADRLSDEAITYLTSGPYLSITYDGVSAINITQGEHLYALRRKADPAINLDTWLINHASYNKAVLFEGTDIEGPIKLAGRTDYIGGIHGDEVMTAAKFLVDGIDITENGAATFDNAKQFTAHICSNVYDIESDSIMFYREKTLSFHGNILLITNRWVYVNDEQCKVERWPACGLYSVYNDLLKGITVGTKFYSIDEIADIVPDPEIKKAVFWLHDTCISLKALTGCGEYEYQGRGQYYSNEERPRYKVYFEVLSDKKELATLKKDDVLSASFCISVGEETDSEGENRQKVYIEKREGTSTIMSLHPVGVTDDSSGSKENLFTYTGIKYNVASGDESTEGRAQLILGNNIAAGTEGNKTGRLTLYSADGVTAGALVQENSTNQWPTSYLPGEGGVLLSTNNYSNYTVPKNGNSTIKGNLSVDGGTSGVSLKVIRKYEDTTYESRHTMRYDTAAAFQLVKSNIVVNEMSVYEEQTKFSKPINVTGGPTGENAKTTLSNLGAASKSELDSLRDEIGSIQVGGRNLIENSATMTGGAWGSWTDSSSVTMERKLKNDVVYQWSIEASDLSADAWSNVYTSCGSANDPLMCKGEQVNMSVWYYVDSAKTAVDSTVYFELGSYNAQGQYVAGNSLALTDDNLKKDRWTQIALSYTPTSDDECYVNCTFGIRKNGNVAFSMPKLERGKIITDWSLAPEDILRAMA